MRTHALTACNLLCGKPMRPCIQDAHARPMGDGGDTPYTLTRRFLSTHEHRHVPSHVPFQQGHMTTHVTFFNMEQPLWPNPSSAIAQGYVVSTHKRSNNLRCVKEIYELVIRKVSAQFSTWRGPSGRIHRVQWSTVMLSVLTNTVTICDL